MAGEKGIQDDFLDFCAAQAAAAVEYGYRQEAREWYEAIGLFMVVRFKMIDMLRVTQSPANLWQGKFAAGALTPVWATQVSLLGRPGGDETERRVALVLKEWIERECPDAAEDGQELVDDRGMASGAIQA